MTVAAFQQQVACTGRSSKMKKTLAISLCFLTSLAYAGQPILPPNWVSPESLENAEVPIQKQLDTGLAMNSTAYDMANVKDARLLVTYVLLFQKLDMDGQQKLFKEQELWLADRKKQILKLNDPDGGSEVRLEMASKMMDMTDQRIKVLSARLAKLGN